MRALFIIHHHLNLFDSMNAQEAKQIASNFILESKDSQLAEILQKIKAEATKGKYEMWYYKHIRKEVAEELRKLGYTIGKEQFDRNETLIEIKWS